MVKIDTVNKILKSNKTWVEKIIETSLVIDNSVPVIVFKDTIVINSTVITCRVKNMLVNKKLYNMPKSAEELWDLVNICFEPNYNTNIVIRI